MLRWVFVRVISTQQMALDPHVGRKYEIVRRPFAGTGNWKLRKITSTVETDIRWANEKKKLWRNENFWNMGRCAVGAGGGGHTYTMFRPNNNAAPPTTGKQLFRKRNFAFNDFKIFMKATFTANDLPFSRCCRVRLSLFASKNGKWKMNEIAIAVKLKTLIST